MREKRWMVLAATFTATLAVSCTASANEYRQATEPELHDEEASIPLNAGEAFGIGGCNGSYMFNCGNGQCIPLSQKCDGQWQCSNRADEKFCVHGSALSFLEANVEIH